MRFKKVLQFGSHVFCLLVIFILLLGGWGCSPGQTKKNPPPQVSLEQEEAAEEEAPPREGLIYSPQKLGASVFPPEITLVWGGEPIAVSKNLQVLLVGILSDDRPLALVEVNGKGKVLEIGEVIGEYKAIAIDRGGVGLEHAQD